MMTEAQDTTDRATKRLRRAARILMLIWASWSTFSLVGLVCFMHALPGLCSEWGKSSTPLSQVMPFGSGYLVLACLALIPWVSAAVAWRRDRTGGFVLFIVGVVQCLVYPPAVWALDPCTPHIRFSYTQNPATDSLILTRPAALLASLAGILFLASWWKSRSPAPPQATE